MLRSGTTARTSSRAAIVTSAANPRSEEILVRRPHQRRRHLGQIADLRRHERLQPQLGTRHDRAARRHAVGQQSLDTAGTAVRLVSAPIPTHGASAASATHLPPFNDVSSTTRCRPARPPRSPRSTTTSRRPPRPDHLAVRRARPPGRDMVRGGNSNLRDLRIECAADRWLGAASLRRWSPLRRGGHPR